MLSTSFGVCFFTVIPEENTRNTFFEALLDESALSCHIVKSKLCALTYFLEGGSKIYLPYYLKFLSRE
jgi:hypothetical protein